MYAIHSWYILDARPSDAPNTVIVQTSFSTRMLFPLQRALNRFEKNLEMSNCSPMALKPRRRLTAVPLS